MWLENSFGWLPNLSSSSYTNQIKFNMDPQIIIFFVRTMDIIILIGEFKTIHLILIVNMPNFDTLMCNILIVTTSHKLKAL